MPLEILIPDDKIRFDFATATGNPGVEIYRAPELREAHVSHVYVVQRGAVNAQCVATVNWRPAEGESGGGGNWSASTVLTIVPGNGAKLSPQSTTNHAVLAPGQRLFLEVASGGTHVGQADVYVYGATVEAPVA